MQINNHIMSSHHDDHSTEEKTVSFKTPIIMGLVTVLIILLAVSTCDRKQHCHATAEHHSGHEASKVVHTSEASVEETHHAVTEEHAVVADTLVKAEEHAPTHH